MTVNFIISSVSEGGTYFRTHHLARALSSLGHTVCVFGIDQDPRSKERQESRSGVRYHIVPSSRGQRIFGQEHHPLAGLFRTSRDYGNCDVLHVFQPFLTTYLPWRTA